jgi:hypothetical protein
MKSKKQLLEEIRDDVMKNQLSRELELEHVVGYLFPKALKIGNKEERKANLNALENRKKELKEEMDARKSLLKVINEKLK